MTYHTSAPLGADDLGPTVTTTPPEHSDPAWVAPVLIIGLIGVVGVAMYMNYKVTSRIAEKEGSKGLLRYHAGTAAIGLAGQWLEPRR